MTEPSFPTTSDTANHPGGGTGNPFESGPGDWLVVVDDQGRHALWRPFLPPLTGWRTVHSGPSRDAALSYVERTWVQPRPDGAGS
jgi:MbtH protein